MFFASLTIIYVALNLANTTRGCSKVKSNEERGLISPLLFTTGIEMEEIFKKYQEKILQKKFTPKNTNLVLNS